MKTASKPGGDKNQKAVAAETEAANTEPVVVSGAIGTTRPKSVGRMIRRRPQDVVALAAVVLVLVVSSTWVYNNNRQQTVCSDQLLGGASKAIDAPDWNSVAKYQTEILAKKHYDKDPNCLYLSFRIALMRKDPAAANKYLQDLRNLPGLKPGAEPKYSKALTTQIFTLSRAQQLVTDLQQSQKSDQQQSNADQAKQIQMDQQADKLIQEKGKQQ